MASRPAFFEQKGDLYVPTGLGISVWSPDAQGGVALAALLAVLLEREIPADSLLGVAKLTIDIFGVVPSRPMKGKVAKIRGGSRMQHWMAELIIEDRVVARASALCLREAQSPHVMQESRYPHPNDVPLGPFLPPGIYHDFVRTRPVQGSVMEPGPGVVWMAMDFDVVEGLLMSPLARASLLGDLGHGVGSPMPGAPWSWANVDIGINFLRLPRGEWVLIDALTQSAGNGRAVVRNIFADVDGVYAYGVESIFVAPTENAA